MSSFEEASQEFDSHCHHNLALRGNRPSMLGRPQPKHLRRKTVQVDVDRRMLLPFAATHGHAVIRARSTMVQICNDMRSLTATATQAIHLFWRKVRNSVGNNLQYSSSSSSRVQVRSAGLQSVQLMSSASVFGGSHFS